MAGRIEEKHDGEVLFFGFFAGKQTCRIVSGGFDVAGPVGGGAVIIDRDHRIDRLDAAFVVGTDRHDHDDQFIFQIGVDADLRRGSEHHRADVK